MANLQCALDDTNGTDLNAHSSGGCGTHTITGTWTRHAGTTSNAGLFAGNRARSGAAASQNVRYYDPDAPSDADYSVYGTLHVASNSGRGGVLGRVASGSQDCYLGRYTGTAWEIGKIVGGTFTSLATSNATLTVGNDYTLELRMSGSSLSLFVNGTSTVTVTDGTISATGFAGIFLFDSATPSDSTGYHVDNFAFNDTVGGGAGTFGGGGTTPSSTDSATVSEGTPSIGLSGPSDSSSTSESASLGLGTTDSGTVAEGPVGVRLGATDAGSTAETASAAAALNATDSATESEQASTSAAVSATDSVTLGESASQTSSGGPNNGSESGGVTESAGVGAAVSASDLAALSEQAAVALGAADSTALAEQIRVGLAIADSASLTEQLQIAVAATATDAAALGQLQTIVAVIQAIADTAALGESAHVTVNGPSAAPVRILVARARPFVLVARARPITLIARAA